MSERAVKYLLVDDLEENLIALEALLARDGLECLAARSGEEALELLLVHDFALALLDVQMPGMDGFELAEIMRADKRSRHVPIIFVTAGTDDAQRRFRGYEAGAVDFILKPIETDILRSKTNVFFDLYAQRTEILHQRDELEALADALRASDKRKNEFLAVLGHELRNPVMAFGAGLQLLGRSSDPERAERIRQNMAQQVAQVSRLVEDLLDIVRIDRGTISLRKERILLQDALALAVETTRHKIEAGRHRLTLDLPDEPVWLNADRARIVQCVGNLVGNAAKYSEPESDILLKATTEGARATIEVSDTGIGISPEMQGRIFEMFTQAGSPSGATGDGLGIGLALVRQLAEMHGGSIALAHSTPGEGSTFVLHLPYPGNLDR